MTFEKQPFSKKPVWQTVVIKDGQKIPTDTAQAENGTLLVLLPAEKTEVEVSFTEPPRTKISLLIAALGWTMTFALLIISFVKSKTVKI